MLARGKRKGFPHLFQRVSRSPPPGGGAQPASPSSPFLTPPPRAAEGRGEDTILWQARSSPAPGWFFPAVEVGPTAGVRGVSAPTAWSREGTATLGRLELALGAAGEEVRGPGTLPPSGGRAAAVPIATRPRSQSLCPLTPSAPSEMT